MDFPALSLCSSISFHFTISDCTDVLPPRLQETRRHSTSCRKHLAHVQLRKETLFDSQRIWRLSVLPTLQPHCSTVWRQMLRTQAGRKESGWGNQSESSHSFHEEALYGVPPAGRTDSS